MALPLRPSEFSLCLGYKHKQPAAPNPKITEFRENKKLTGQGGTPKALSGTLFIHFFFFFFFAIKSLTSIYCTLLFARHCSLSLGMYWCTKKDVFPANSPKQVIAKEFLGGPMVRIPPFHL